MSVPLTSLGRDHKEDRSSLDKRPLASPATSILLFNVRFQNKGLCDGAGPRSHRELLDWSGCVSGLSGEKNQKEEANMQWLSACRLHMQGKSLSLLVQSLLCHYIAGRILYLSLFKRGGSCSAHCTGTKASKLKVYAYKIS